MTTFTSLKKVDETKEQSPENAVLDDNKFLLTREEINLKIAHHFPDNFNKETGHVICPIILPVVHVLHPSKTNCLSTVYKNIDLVLKHKFNGIFLINHGFQATGLVSVIKETRQKYPKLFLGVNFLGLPGDKATDFINRNGLNDIIDGLWIDNGAINYSYKNTNTIITSYALKRIKKFKKSKWNKNGLYFGGLDFKYQNQLNLNDSNYNNKLVKLVNTSKIGFMDVLCTSGSGTGKEANLMKMKIMRKQLLNNGNSKLAVASGISPENVSNYLDYIDFILVATGISNDFHNFSDEKMKQMRKIIDEFVKNNKKN